MSIAFYLTGWSSCDWDVGSARDDIKEALAKEEKDQKEWMEKPGWNRVNGWLESGWSIWLGGESGQIGSRTEMSLWENPLFKGDL